MEESAGLDRAESEITVNRTQPANVIFTRFGRIALQSLTMFASAVKGKRNRGTIMATGRVFRGNPLFAGTAGGLAPASKR